jgi:hypothetical protein
MTMSINLAIEPLDGGPDYTRGVIIGVLRGIGITVRSVNLADIEPDDPELLARIERELVHPADHGLLDDAGAAAAVEEWAARPSVDHEALRDRAARSI